jgi:hypothetical protein
VARGKRTPTVEGREERFNACDSGGVVPSRLVGGLVLPLHPVGHCLPIALLSPNRIGQGGCFLDLAPGLLTLVCGALCPRFVSCGKNESGECENEPEDGSAYESCLCSSGTSLSVSSREAHSSGPERNIFRPTTECEIEKRSTRNNAPDSGNYASVRCEHRSELQLPIAQTSEPMRVWYAVLSEVSRQKRGPSHTRSGRRREE